MTKIGIAICALALAFCTERFVATDPVIHMLVQVPALICVGFMLGTFMKAPQVAVGALFILGLFTALIWMLPRYVDAAAMTWGGAVAKWTSLPLCCGMPLGLSWPRLGPILRGIIKAQFISMLLVLSFLYSHAPVRICNAYLVDDQQRLALGFAYSALALCIIWLLPIFVGPATDPHRKISHEH